MINLENDQRPLYHGSGIVIASLQPHSPPPLAHYKTLLFSSHFDDIHQWYTLEYIFQKEKHALMAI